MTQMREQPASNQVEADEPNDAAAAAKAAHLRYVSDRMPGITRERGNSGFAYRLPDGNVVSDDRTLARIKSLVIPPAWESVWICRLPHGHLQAVGRDAKGRKQYRYHPRWRVVRDESKYDRMLLFGRTLPQIRDRVAADLAKPGLSREKVLAAIVRLLETTLARIGNEEYARSNRSFGLTTLRNRHVRVAGARMSFDFRGKHGIQHHIDLQDRRLAAIVKKCRDLPGQELFQYLDAEGQSHGIGSEDVNDYLREISGEEITAKDFRTWAATNLAAIALRELEAFDSQAAAKRNVLQAVEAVAKLLGNTPAICRKCYIHPAIFEGYLDGSLLEGLKERAEAMLDEPDSGLTAEEVAVTAFLARSLGEANEADRAGHSRSASPGPRHTPSAAPGTLPQ
jgi:DNA topoisomerase I